MSNESSVEIAKKAVVSEGVRYGLPLLGAMALGAWAILRRHLAWSDTPPLAAAAALGVLWFLYRRERRSGAQSPSFAPTTIVARSEAPEKVIVIRLSQIRIQIAEADNGAIFFTLLAINFGSQPIEAEKFDLHGITIGTYQLSLNDHSISKSFTVPPGELAELSYSLSLASANIRLAIRGIAPAGNSRSMPSATIRLSGTLALSCLGKRFSTGVESQIAPVQISITNNVIDEMKASGQLVDY